MTSAPNLCLWRRNFCAAGGCSSFVTAAQNIHVFLPKLPLHKKHFFVWLKAANFSIVCGTVTLKSPPSRGTDAPRVHPRPRKRLSRCTLDCGFKTSESPALRGFVAERGQIRGTSLSLVLKSNGPRSLSLPKVSTHSAFGEKSHTTAYAAKQGRFGWGCCHSRHEPHVPKPPLAGYQNGKLCRFWVLVRCTPEARRRRCSAGVAAPLGCVIFFCFYRNCSLHVLRSCFLRMRGRDGITTLGVLRVLPKRAVRRCQNG